ncbi:MAG: hypothetical protein HDQ88_03325 [Clostridia bacterium]|nr:hypothetical protein [Clostridia bacterium]
MTKTINRLPFQKTITSPTDPDHIITRMMLNAYGPETPTCSICGKTIGIDEYFAQCPCCDQIFCKDCVVTNFENHEGCVEYIDDESPDGPRSIPI